MKNFDYIYDHIKQILRKISGVKNTEAEDMEKIVNEVLSIRRNLTGEQLPENIETGDIYSLADLYAEHAAMFEMLSERLLDVKLGILIDGKSEIREILGGEIHEIKKGHIEKLKEIKGKLDSNNKDNKKIIELIDEVIELKEIKKHIAVDRLRAIELTKLTNYLEKIGVESPEKFISRISKATELSEIKRIVNKTLSITYTNKLKKIGKKNKNKKRYEALKSEFFHSIPNKLEPMVNKYMAVLIAAKHKEEYDKNKESFTGIPNSIQITDIHNDIYHFLLGMTEPINGQPAFTIGNPVTKKEKIGDKEYEYPNLIYNPEFNGTITFGGDLIQSHDSTIKDDKISAIPLCLAMRNCMRQANYEIDEEVGGYKKLNPSIVYVAGNHEMEALNEGQHPEVRTIMQEMFKEGLVEYCHYDRNPEPNGIFISHTKLNKPLVEVIGNNVEGYNDLFDGKKPDRKLKEIDSNEKRKLLTKMLNENFDKHFEICGEALFQPDPNGINDFAIVGEELERTYFRKDKEEYDCEEAIKNFKDSFGEKVSEEEKEDKFKKLEALQKMTLALSGAKGKVKIKEQIKDQKEEQKEEEKYIKNFTDLRKWSDYPIKVEAKDNITFFIEKGDNDTIILKKSSIKKGSEGEKNEIITEIIGKPFTFDEAGELFAKAINSNPNSRPYSLMNRGALCNFSGGLFGYENDHPEEALDLGCSHVVGHRPTLLQKGFVSLNIPIVKSIEGQTEKSLQSDYNGKNEDKYINCRITKFDSEGKPHLVGISKMLEKHREFFKKIDPQNNLDANIGRLFDDVYSKQDVEEKDYENKKKKFIEYFMTNNLLMRKKLGDTNELELKNELELRASFEEVGEKFGLKIKEGRVNFIGIINNFSFIEDYQKAFSKNRKKVIDKQENIKTKALGQGQAQRQMI